MLTQLSVTIGLLNQAFAAAPIIEYEIVPKTETAIYGDYSPLISETAHFASSTFGGLGEAILSEETAPQWQSTSSPEYFRWYIQTYASSYGLDPEKVIKIVACESGFNPKAKNPKSTATGLLQFINSTWNSTLKKMGWPRKEKTDPIANLDVGMFLMATEGDHHWSSSARCWKQP